MRAGRWFSPGRERGRAAAAAAAHHERAWPKNFRSASASRVRSCLSARSTSASARHSSGCGAGSSSSRSSSDPTGTFACSPRPGSSTEMTQRPDCSTFRHSTRSDDSTVSSPPRRCSTSTWIGAFSFSSAFARRSPRPIRSFSPLAVIGASGSGGGAAGSIGSGRRKVSSHDGSEPYGTSRERSRCSPNCSATLSVEAPCARSTIDCTKARPPRSERWSIGSVDCAAADDGAPPAASCAAAALCRAAPSSADDVRPSAGTGSSSARMRLRSANTPFSERWRWIRCLTWARSAILRGRVWVDTPRSKNGNLQVGLLRS